VEKHGPAACKPPGQQHQPTIAINPSNPLPNAKRADDGTTAEQFSSTGD
jgi:hypothetical protein